MKQIKKIISLFFAFAMVLSCIDMPLAIKAEEEYQPTAQITMEEINTSNELFSNTIVEIVGDLDISATQQLDEQGEKVTLVVTASTSNENRNIIQARAPNGKIIQGDTISYLASSNRTYEFEFTYEENGVKKTQLHYAYVFDSKLMSDALYLLD